MIGGYHSGISHFYESDSARVGGGGAEGGPGGGDHHVKLVVGAPQVTEGPSHIDESTHLDLEYFLCQGIQRNWWQICATQLYAHSFYYSRGLLYTMHISQRFLFS